MKIVSLQLTSNWWDNYFPHLGIASILKSNICIKYNTFYVIY